MEWQHISKEIAAIVEPCRGQGRVADYIPALAAIDPMKFGLAIALGDGNLHCLGDAEETFSIQSISKVFTLSMALGKVCLIARTTLRHNRWSARSHVPVSAL